MDSGVTSMPLRQAMRRPLPVLATLIVCASVRAPLDAQQYSVPDSEARVRVSIAGSNSERLEGIVRYPRAATPSLAAQSAGRSSVSGCMS